MIRRNTICALKASIISGKNSPNPSPNLSYRAPAMLLRFGLSSTNFRSANHTQGFWKSPLLNDIIEIQKIIGSIQKTIKSRNS